MTVDSLCRNCDGHLNGRDLGERCSPRQCGCQNGVKAKVDDHLLRLAPRVMRMGSRYAVRREVTTFSHGRRLWCSLRQR